MNTVRLCAPFHRCRKIAAARRRNTGKHPKTRSRLNLGSCFAAIESVVFRSKNYSPTLSLNIRYRMYQGSIK